MQCLHFDYEALRDATQNFDRRKVNNGGCLLGEGGFGPVYRGMLKMTEVAIKELRKVNMVSVHPSPSAAARHDTTAGRQRSSGTGHRAI